MERQLDKAGACFASALFLERINPTLSPAHTSNTPPPHTLWVLRVPER